MATLASAELKLWVYRGQIDTYTGDPQYTITKNKIPGETTIVFEISELVKDYAPVVFDGNYSAAETVAWASWELTSTFDDTPDPTTTLSKGTRLVTNGYGYFENEINPQLHNPLQQSNTCIYWLKGETVRVPVFTEEGISDYTFNQGNVEIAGYTYFPNSGIDYITIDSGDIKASFTSPTADATFTKNTDTQIFDNDIVIAPTDTEQIVITLSNGTTIDLNVNYVDEFTCGLSINEDKDKNKPFKVTFVNKFGALQDIWFFGRRKESANVSREQFTINTIEASAGSVLYKTNKATDIIHNVKSNKSLVLNTGFVCEDYNEVVQQLLQSEYVWIHEDSKVYPIIPTDNSIEYKDGKYDKLLNYKVNFKYAYNEINNVR